MDGASGESAVSLNYLVPCLCADHRQIWGFEDLQGQRRFVRRVVVKKEDQVEKIKLVYDFEK